MNDVDVMPADKLCHYNRQPCMRDQCVMWRKIQGRDANTGETVNRWDCADATAILIDLERNAALRELNAEMATLRAEHYIATETTLTMIGRPDILLRYRERRDHVRALNRTEELVRERAAVLDHQGG